MAKRRSRSTIFVLGFRLLTFKAFLLDSLFSSTSSSSVSSRSLSPLSTASSLNHLEAVMVFEGGGGRIRCWFEKTVENVFFYGFGGFFRALDVRRDDARGASLRPAADVETTGGGGGGVFVVPTLPRPMRARWFRSYPRELNSVRVYRRRIQLNV